MKEFIQVKGKTCKKTFSRSSILKKHKMIHTRKNSQKKQYLKETFIKMMAPKFHETIHAEKPIDISMAV